MDVRMDMKLMEEDSKLLMVIDGLFPVNGQTRTIRRAAKICNPKEKIIKVLFEMNVEAWANLFPREHRFKLPQAELNRWALELWEQYVETGISELSINRKISCASWAGNVEINMSRA